MADFVPPSDAVESSPPAQSGGGFVPPSDAVETSSSQSGAGRGSVNPPMPTEPPEQTTVTKSILQRAANMDPKIGATEAVANLISQVPGFGAYFTGGLTGLVAEAFGMPKGYAKDLAERAQKNVVYEPQTEQGKKAAGVVNYPLEKINEASEAAGQHIAKTAGSEYDQQIRHVEQYGAPKWFTGTKEEYLARLKGDQKKAEEAGAVEGALVESTGQVVGPMAAGGVIAKGAGKVAEKAKVKETTPSTSELPERPKETATPEEKQAYKDKIQEVIKQRRESSPLKETAIRNKETGEIERMGAKHDEARKAETKDTHEEGFVTERGDFLNRKEAYEQAKRTGMLDKDHDSKTLEFPDEGLHSGDLRKAGVDRFKLSEEERKEKEGEAPKEDEKIPVGETKEVFTPPKDAVVEEPPKHTEEGPPPEETPREEHPEEPLAGKGMGDFVPETREDYKEVLRNLEREYLDHLANARWGKADRVQRMMDHAKEKMPPPKIENPQRLTSDELHDVMWDVHTVGEAIERAQQSGIGFSHYQRLFDALASLKGIRDVKIEFANEELYWTGKDGERKQARGLHWSAAPNSPQRIQIGKGALVPTMLHEMVHAATERLLRDPNSQAAAKFHDLFDKYNKAYTKNLLEKKARGEAVDEHYGFLNADEFMAEAFSNWKFQLYLDGIKLEGEKSALGKPATLWTRFKDSIADVLKGLDKTQRTALDEILEHGTDVIKEQEAKFQEREAKANKPITFASEAKEGEIDTGSEKLDKLVGDIDVRTIPDKKTFLEHATDMYEKFGEEAAMDFFEAYKKEVKDRQIPVPETNEDLSHNFHTMDGFTMSDKSEHVTGYKDSTKAGVTDEERKSAFDAIEAGADPSKVSGKLGEVLKALHDENKALVRKAKAMGIKVGDEFTKGQNRIRLFGSKDRIGKVWQDFFANRTPFGEKIAEQAANAHERKVFGLKGNPGRVVEIHRITKEHVTKFKDSKTGAIRTKVVKPGTQIWEWKDGHKQLIAHSDMLDFKKGDIVDSIDGKENLMLDDGDVHSIEKHSPYRYLHDAEAAARISNMGLRKYVREAEYFKNLTESKLFEVVGHSPDKPLDTLPKGWKVPENIDRIPQLRGWHFDPKTAAIIEDFAKVWDNNGWMKMTNQIIKAIMLNPLPHMMNEAMHLWNARGFTGWVSPGGLSRLARTGKEAWNDVAKQTPFYRELMREGGSILGATPRNAFFEKITENASKELMKDKKFNRSMTGLAMKMGTSVADLYNGISRKSQQAMWFTRDVMYTQYVREIMEQHEKRTGETLSIKDATERAGEHMPTYHLPSQIAGSRTISKVLRNPNIATFSSYHYGVVNSLVNTLKDLNPKNLKDVEGRQRFKDGVDTALAIGVAMYALYPLADKFAEMIFGEGATVRRAGPYHVIEGLTAVMKGEKDLTGLLWPVFSFNPMLALMGQLALNKKMFTGKEIYHPNDSLGENLQDAGDFVLKQIPQVGPLSNVSQDEGAPNELLAKQLDIKAPSAKKQSIIERAKKRQEIAKKSRETARKHGKYNQ